MKFFASVLTGAMILVTSSCSSPDNVRFSAVYFDIDGTLLGSSGTLSDPTLKAIHRYKACGGHVGVATGRTLPRALPVVEKIGADLPTVWLNGGCVDWNDGSSPAMGKISQDQLTSLLLQIRSVDTLVGVAMFDCGKVWLDRATPEMLANVSADCLAPGISTDLKLHSPDGPQKVLVFIGDETDSSVIVSAIRKSLPTLSVRQAAKGILEVMPEGTNKGEAVKRALESVGLSPHDCIAFGDGDNDVSMFETVAVPLAMGNATQASKNAAVATVGDRDSSAIAEAISRFAILRSCRR